MGQYVLQDSATKQYASETTFVNTNDIKKAKCYKNGDNIRQTLAIFKRYGVTHMKDATSQAVAKKWFDWTRNMVVVDISPKKKD